jgi:hypothetical protein
MDTETAEEVKRHFNVVAEGLRADIRVVIVGVSANTDRLERVEVRLDWSRFDSTGSRGGSPESRGGSPEWRDGSPESRGGSPESRVRSERSSR